MYLCRRSRRELARCGHEAAAAQASLLTRAWKCWHLHLHLGYQHCVLRTPLGGKTMKISETQEGKRLAETQQQKMPLRRWGPYLSERQWGTVREDNSDNGDAWDYFSLAAARSHTYRWGEDGIVGISDDMQRLCFALALWDGEDGF